MEFYFADDNDWRIEHLELAEVNKELIAKILSRMKDISNPVVQVLEPGLSGFFVLAVTYRDDKTADNRYKVLKIRKCKNAIQARRLTIQEKASKKILEQVRVPNEIFYYLETFLTIDKKWLCFIYEMAIQRVTYRQFFSNYIKDSNFELNNGLSIIKDVFARYGKGKWNCNIEKIVQTPLWRGKKNFNNLEQKKYYKHYLKNTYAVINRRPELAKAIGINKGDVLRLLYFIKTDKFDNAFIDAGPESFPVSRIHGDLNGGNVLVEPNNGQNAIFIDFGQMSQACNSHALIDIVKLSIDFEKFILPSIVFDYNRPVMLSAWTEIHNTWIQGKDISAYNNSTCFLLYRLYMLQSGFREIARNILGDPHFALTTEQADRNFLFVRLHYLMRILNHDHVEDVRKLFAIRASLDVLALINGTARAAKDPRDTEVSFDCTAEEFESHLIRHETILIMGVTNEHLADHLRKAYKERISLGKSHWKELKIIYQARHLLKHVNDQHRELQTRVKGWTKGVAEVRHFLLGEGEKKADKIYLLHVNTIFPFIGQLYDGKHLRIAHILPKNDFRKNCYINYATDSPPCSKYIFNEMHGFFKGETLPPCKLGSQDNCKAGMGKCSWKQASCRMIKNAMDEIDKSSTPLFAANVVGSFNNGKFVFSLLLPQNNWRKFSDLIPGGRLLSFVLVTMDNNIILQLRTPLNSSGDFDKMGLISGMVNDEDLLGEDFFASADAAEHRNNVYDMQMAFDAVNEANHQADDHRNDALKSALEISNALSTRFANRVGIRRGVEISDDILKHACKNTSKRMLHEKLGIDLPDNVTLETPLGNELHPVDIYGNLSVMVYNYRVDEGTYSQACIAMPNANLMKISSDEFKTLRDQNKLSHFLQHNFDEIHKYVYDQR